MKFRTIFFLFNLIIFLSFAFIFLMPLPILGWAYALTFWSQNWSIALLFLVVLASLDTYFIAHWRLYTLLEREDWPGLKAFLEGKLKAKGVLNLQESRIFINACLIGQAPTRISELREQYVAQKVRFLAPLALSLGLPLVLEGKSAAIKTFFEPFAQNRATGSDGPWIRWCLAFGDLLGGNQDSASKLLRAQLNEKNLLPLQELLCLYLLDNLKATDAAAEAVLKVRVPALAARHTDKEWTEHIDRLKESVVLVLFMAKLIQDARDWLKSSSGVPE